MIELQDAGQEGSDFEGLAIEEMRAEYDVLLGQLHTLPEREEAMPIAARMRAITQEILRRFGLDEGE